MTTAIPSVRGPVRRAAIIAGLLLILATAALLRAHALSAAVLQPDEYEVLTSLEHAAQTPSLYIAALRAWSSLAGRGETALRVFSMLCGLAAILILFSMARRMFGALGALAGLTLLALSHAYVAMSVTIAPDALFLMLAAGSLATLPALQDARRASLLGLHLGVNVLLAAFGAAALLVWAAELMLVLFARTPWRVAVAWTAVHALLAASVFFSFENTPSHPPSLLSPFLLVARYLAPGGAVQPYFPPVQEAIPISAPDARAMWLTGVYGRVAALQALACLTLLSSILLAGLSGRLRGRVHSAAVAALLWWPVFTILLLGTARFWSGDVLSHGLPETGQLGAALAVAAAMVLSRATSVRFAVLTLILSLVGFQYAVAHGFPQRVDWRATTEFIQERTSRDDTIVVPDSAVAGVLTHYLQAIPADILLGDTEQERLELSERAWSRGRRVLWILPFTLPDLHDRALAYARVRDVRVETLSIAGAPPWLMYLLEPGTVFAALNSAAGLEQARRAAVEAADPWTPFLLGATLEAFGHEEPAREAYRRVLALLPREHVVFPALAQALARVGDVEMAVGLLGGSADPADPAVAEVLAESHVMAGHTAEAVATYRRALARYPDHPALLPRLADLLARLGQTGEAVDLYRRIAAARPDDLSARQRLGMLLLGEGNPARALEPLREALALARPGGGNLPLLLAEALADTGQSAELFSLHSRLAEEGWPRESVQWVLGRALENAGQAPEALRAYRDAIAAAPAFVDAYARADSLLTRLGETGQRVEFWRRLAREQPDAARAHFMLGLALGAARDPAGAEQAIARAAQLDPEDPGYESELAALEVCRGAWQEALARLERVLARSPSFARAHEVRVEALLQMGDSERAAGALERARESGVMLPEALVHAVEAGRM